MKTFLALLLSRLGFHRLDEDLFELAFIEFGPSLAG
jgi:hypothetical protein